MKYDKYIGLPYKNNGRTADGVDCWGLVRLFYKDEFAIELPSYSDEYNGPNDEAVVYAVNQHKDAWDPTSTPDVGDVVLFNILGEPTHVGIYLGNNKFLHSRAGKDSVVESLAGAKWNKRLEGVYKYSSNTQVEVIGAPHPLKTMVLRDWTVAGTTLQNFVDYTQKKYSFSTKFASKITLVLDGVPVPQSQWATTTVQAGQVLAYRAVPEGDNTFRMLLMLAVVVVAPQLAAAGLGELGIAATTVNAAGVTVATWQATAATIAIQMAGMALINAIMPVRMPTQNDPGSAGASNLFTGANNQANRFGPIPAVLGKVRITGSLGATPYIQTLQDTTVINLLVVWGFGPLSVADICVGSNPLDNYYKDSLVGVKTPYATLNGEVGEDDKNFNSLYGVDVEQAPVKSIELINNSSQGSPWSYIYFNQQSTRVDVSFNFPEGMRTVSTKTGDTSQATAGVEIQLGTYTVDPVTQVGTWGFDDTPTYTLGKYNSSTQDVSAYTTILEPAGYSGSYSDEYQPLYRYSTFALAPGGGVQRFDGVASDNQNIGPSQYLIDMYRSGAYADLVGTDITYNLKPQIPAGYYKLYTVCVYGTGGVISQENHIRIPTNPDSVSGLELTRVVVVTGYSDDGGFYEKPTGSTEIQIAKGSVFKQAQEVATPTGQAIVEEIFNSRQYTGISNGPSSNRYCDFLKNYGVQGSGENLDITTTVNFPYNGYYAIEASADDEGEVYVDYAKILTMPKSGYGSTVKASNQYFDKGERSVRLVQTNSGGSLKSAAVKITYTTGGANVFTTKRTEIIFGSDGFYEKHKDAFGHQQTFQNLPLARYAVRCRRTSDDTADITDARRYFKVILSTAACFNNTRPTVNPVGCRLAKTAIKVQSTNKVNGSIDGVNAIVQSRALDWNKATQNWVIRETNNPASLFAYVLTHPANAFRIAEQDRYAKINMAALAEWHEFCDGANPSGGRLCYNNIITNSMSVMDVLRDICAAGMGSPAYVDGKWTVVVDKPRAYTTQYFTTYNSWGFESTKALPKLPHAFRITINDESLAYQPKEYVVYNYGYSETGQEANKTQATLFETLTLPGVTNGKQAQFLAKWHLAQLTLRPETYTLNTDFEYLVCTRGDVVKVTHDIPQWGVASGRLKSADTYSSAVDPRYVVGTKLTLSEPIYLLSGKTYSILIRTNSASSNGITKNFTVTAGWHNTINLSSPLVAADKVELDNLFMIGELNYVTQELVVISVEPTSDIGAKLTLVDYAPKIYTANLDELQTFESNITAAYNYNVVNTINTAPGIVQVTSDTTLSEEISGGTYQNVVIVSFSNSTGLTSQAQQIESQVVLGDADFGSTSLTQLYRVDKEVSSLTVNGLKTGKVYKIRSRYSNKAGTITGPWSEVYYFTNIGKDTNYYSAPTLDMDLNGTEIVATPSVGVVKPQDFKHYEYRIYKDTGSEDFWELPVNETTYKIQTTTSTNEGRFDLIKQPKPRISSSGITYRVAVRAVDNTGNYSETSTLGTIVVKTIQ